MKGVENPRGTGEEGFLSLHESKGAAEARWVLPQQPRARLETAPVEQSYTVARARYTGSSRHIPITNPPLARGSKNRYLGEFSRRF